MITTEYCRTEIHINGRQPLPYQLAVTEYEDRANWRPIELPEGVYFELLLSGKTQKSIKILPEAP